jgi:hypothetical protein
MEGGREEREEAEEKREVVQTDEERAKTDEDRRLLSADYLRSVQKGGVEGGLGDWLAVETKSQMITGVGFMLQSLLAHAHLCSALCVMPTADGRSDADGKDGCACDGSGGSAFGAEMSQRAASLRRNIIRRFFDGATGHFSQGPEIDRLLGGDGEQLAESKHPPRQCAQAMLIYLGLLQEIHTAFDGTDRNAASAPSHSASSSSSSLSSSASLALQALVDSVRLPPAHGHLMVGTFGIKWVLMALADYAGHNGQMTAYESVVQRSYPGYGFMLDYASYYATRHEHQLHRADSTGQWVWEGRGEGAAHEKGGRTGEDSDCDGPAGGAASPGDETTEEEDADEAYLPEDLYSADGSDTLWETW